MVTPLLSACIPAYNRPKWFERTLRSIMTLPLAEQQHLEIIVSDDSTISDCQKIFETCMDEWQGPRQYVTNSPSLGMAGNWNNCVRIATGEFVLILHDDDYLEPDGASKILDALRENGQYKALLFGVNVVTPQERIKKRQRFRQKHYLEREEALKQILFNSSFVRFPGIVLWREVFEQVGYFDETVGGIADIHLWVRIFNACGVLCFPMTTANYTIHPEALTMDMFNEHIVHNLVNLFDWVEDREWLDSKTLEYCRTNYFHQFILAGSIRYIRLRQYKQASSILNLFDSLQIQPSMTIFRWKSVRFILTIILYPRKLFTSELQSNEA
ncbi:glycosyltransferase [Leptolyngbya sp. SLC-A1]|uniref:glycosyltransferase family 2 protein n=1 Tax=unclassified Leptolyngbya TaxID=2650499 RepID=UPI00329A63E7